MKRHMILIALILASFAHAGKLVAILETVSDRDVTLKGSELRYLTDELRSQALKALPVSKGFELMTRENIQSFLQEILPAGKGVEDCVGECLVETGRNLSAEYVSQARVGMLGKNLTLTVELYETQGAKLIGSFTAEEKDASGLLKVIRDQSPAIFSKIGSIKAKAPGSEQVGIIGLKNSDEDEDSESTPMLLIDIVSEPEGAMVSIDGRPLPSCRNTPCRAEVTAGSHNFYAVLDAHADLEQKVNVQKSGQKIVLKMSANFGTLVLNPKLGANWNPEQLSMLVDGQSLSIGAYRLAPGQHPVRITHPCAQTITFAVGLKKGGTEVFDIALKPKMAGLTMKAEQNKVAKTVPVWVDGKQVGSTPWTGKVPLCADVEVGAEKSKLDVRLDSKKTTTIVYEQP